MKTKNCILFYVVSLFFITTSFAATPQYSIIVDAGSSGSRLHLFQYENNSNIPIIKDIYTKKNSTPLASFASSPDQAGESLKPLLDDTVKKLSAEGIKETIPISVLGTAGMRMLSNDQQKAIYKNVKTYIKNEYTFKVQNTETLSGKMEGLYDWLEVNYLENNFQNNRPTHGSIDMGGASTQIAFETEDLSNPKDEVSLKINNKTYRIFIKSFLGLGLDQARMSIDTYPLSETCYPLNYPRIPSEGHFNFETCDSLYSQLIGKYHVADEIINIPLNQSFVAFSGAFYVYQFFNSLETPDEIFFQTQIKNTCSQSFEQLKQIYPDVPEEYLSAYCAEGVYLQNLFYHAYQLNSSQIQVLNSINEQSIDWTLGALLYQIIKK